MTGMGSSGDFALSMNSVAKLKYSARNSPDEGIKEAAKQFEAVFLQKMLKQMRDAIPQSGLLNSQRSEMYQSLMDQQWAQTLSQRGIGLADMLTQQLQGKSASATPNDNGVDSLLASIPSASPQPLQASNPITARRTDEKSAEKPADDLARKTFARPPLQAAANEASVPAEAVAQTSASDTVRRAVLPDHVNKFLDRMDSAAAVAARETGIPKRLILAQAALETGWGKHEITRADGSPSFNVFNIKATGWDGDAASVKTTEYEGSRRYTTRAEFRAYDSYEQAFSDYARLLTQSPRYKPVVDAPTAEHAARALQNCGYATDPAYANKLVSIMKRLPADAPAPAVQVAQLGEVKSADLTRLF
ncbi:mannosyl-glycoprotein endo-beta-N-acetylglucosamidase [Salinisphaera sp. T5B8]|uniref:flagellar assembly peptidoglycan hydrolase FlgJ n=1 Tax=Salinisphaera sp. T5B8 TaxID=1304154 RepID=UPI0033427332